jgi:MFS family permease
MAQMIEINLHPDERILRQFGWIALGGLGFIAAIAWFEVLIFSFGLGAARVPVVAACGSLAVVSAIFALVYPKANLAVYLGITILTYPIGFVLSYVIMGALFYLIIAPIGLLLRLFGTDPMERRIQPGAESYWLDAGPARPRASYFKQF